MQDYLGSLERLADLFQKGVLSKEEFETEKAHLLASNRVSNTEPLPKTSRFWQNRMARITGIVVLTAAVGVTLGWTVWTEMAALSQPVVETNVPDEQRIVDAISSTIAFDDIKSCQPDSRFAALLERLIDASREFRDGDRLLFIEGRKQPADVHSAKAGTKKEISIASVLLPIKWEGLNTIELRSIEWSEGRGFQLNFAESSTEVIRKLSRLGMNTRQTGEVNREGSRLALVEAHEDGSSWSCFWPLNKLPKSSEGDNDGKE